MTDPSFCLRLFPRFWLLGATSPGAAEPGHFPWRLVQAPLSKKKFTTRLNPFKHL
jgi:hypothetical protein